MPDPDKRRLLFKNPEFQPGVNVTVRNGSKWAGQVASDSIVEVWETNGDYLFDAFIVDVFQHKICDIPQDLLEQEHDPSCRTHQGLITELERVYRKKVSSRDPVTVIVFEQCEPEPGKERTGTLRVH